MYRAPFALIATILAGCATTPPSAPYALASAALSDAAGTTVGTATMLQTDKGVGLNIEVHQLAPGSHGVHLHAIGKCEAPGFSSAGPHLNPAGHQHGSANPAGSHLGDLPNLKVASNGNATLTIPMTTAPDVLLAALFDSDGTAIVVHAGPDDYRTDPSGNSGGRVACGVFARSSN